MKHLALCAGIATLIAASSPTAAAAEAARVIVQYRSATGVTAGGGPPQHGAAMGERLGLPLRDGRPLGPRAQVLTASGLSGSALASRLAAQPDVEWAVVDERRTRLAVPNDPYYGTQTARTPAAGQWYLRASSSSALAAIGAESAWSVTTGRSAVVVAVLDTGVRRDHPDLAGQLLPGYDFVADTDFSNDGDGRDDDPSDPGDWVSASDLRSSAFSGCSASDSSWHGTQVAGLIAAATDNGIGIASVGRQVKVLPVRVLGKCGGYDSDIIAAMRWAAGLAVDGVPTHANPAAVINLSLGGSGSCSRAYQEAVSEVIAAGTAVVAAAGNDGLAVGAPANCSGVVAVAGVRHTGTKVGYSSLGSAVAIAAPAGNCVNTTGTCLYPLVSTSDSGSTVPVGASYTDGDKVPTLGTSFASPLVAGTVALMKSIHPGLTPAKATSLLKTTARAFPSTGADAGVSACRTPGQSAQTSECYCTTSTCGAGLLDTASAVAAAQTAANDSIALPTASVSGSSSLRVGASTVLDGSASAAYGGLTLTAYAWSLDSGSGVVAFDGATSGATVTLAGSAAGTAVLRLTVTDSAGRSSSTTHTVTVQAETKTVSEGSESGSASGGGAASPAWLLGLAAAAGLLRRRPSARRRAAPGPRPPA